MPDPQVLQVRSGSKVDLEKGKLRSQPDSTSAVIEGTRSACPIPAMLRHEAMLA
jgi:hypothetical protein